MLLGKIQPVPVLAQELRTSRAVSTGAAIRLDGFLDEPAWMQAPVISGFLQKDPQEGEPATEDTEIRILYTRKSLFFGIRCYDVKYRITSDLTADFTVNTDFAEADVDAQVLNLTRFPVFFPEKREFFVEGAGIFDYGPGGGAASELKLFFSRRIGLSPDRESIPIRGGGKLTGKSRSWTLGLLDVQTGAFGKIPQRNFAVARVKKDVFSRSNIGFIATNRDSATPGDPYNRGFGGDANFRFFEHFNIQGFATSTFTPGKDKDHWAERVRSFWESDFLTADIELGLLAGWPIPSREASG